MADTILSTTPFHQITSIEPFVIDELTRRSKDYNLVNSKAGQADYNSNYRGPQKVFARFFSNAYSKDNSNGFLMYNSTGHTKFEQFYGIDKSGKQIIGFDINLNPISIDIIQQGLPRPGIVSINVETMGDSEVAGGKYRKTEVKWMCFGFDQLNYLSQYFMSLGTYCFVDWGWNNCGASNIIPLSDSSLIQMHSDENFLWNKITNSKGNYDASLGIISHYSYTQNSNGSFEVTTIISNTLKNIGGIQIGNIKTQPDGNNKQNLKDWSVNYFEKYISSNGHTGVAEIDLDGVNVENRFFVPQDVDSKQSSGFSVSNGNSDIWVRMDLFVDILNTFCAMSMKDSVLKSYVIDISNSWIMGNPNLKSSNGNILLIPNSCAPKGVPKDLDDNNNDSPSPIANNVLFKILQTHARDDHNAILNKNFSADTSFPFYGNINPGVDVNQYPGYAGKIGNLFLKLSFLKESINNNDSFENLMSDILSKMSSAAGGIWNFDVRQVGYKSGGQSQRVTIADTNFIGFKSIQDLISRTTKNSNSTSADGNSIYVFEIAKKNSVVINYGSTVDITKEVAINTMANNFKNAQGVPNFGGINRPIFEPKNIGEDAPKSPAVNDNLEISKRQPSDDNFFYLKIKKTGGQGFFHTFLCEPNIGVLSKLLQDNSPLNGNNVGCIPGMTIDLELLGISGIKFMDGFLIDPAPKIYDQTLFQVTKVSYEISDSQWITKITALIRPLFSTNVGTGQK